MTTTYAIASSAELMDNYVVADVLAPQQEFVALQTVAGTALLFSIGTDQVLHLTLEKPGSATGWERADLTTALVTREFPAGATCRTFAAAQVTGPTGEIHLAVVVTDSSGADHVYVSLGNSGSDPSWAAAPVWTGCPFNAVDDTGRALTAPSPFRVVDVLLSEAADGEYVAIDLLRDPSDPAPDIERFFLDLTTPAAPLWVRHDVAEDVQAEGYSSCLGRAAGRHAIDGLYTHGVAGTATQLTFAPLYNVWDRTQPPPVDRLALPGGAQVDAIAACRNADDTSDLFVASAGALYRFAAADQEDGAVATLMLTHPLVTSVRDLYASVDGDVVTVWGLNGSDEIFYVACPAVGIGTAGAWSVPVPIVTGVDAISPYVDRQYSANTFFAHTGDGLIVATKSPTTLLWQRRPITVPPTDPLGAATKVSSYTTHLQVTGSDGRVAPGVTVSLTAASVTGVLINHLYYRVGPEPIEVTTNELGTVTIVEVVRTLDATRFTATVEGAAAADVNPMSAPFARNSTYTTVESLRAASITAMDGTTRPLLSTGVSDDDLQSVADSNTALATAYDDVSAPVKTRALAAASAANGFDGLLVDVGDLFGWLESGVDAIVEVVKDAATDVWHFVARIGDAIYKGVLDCVEHVVAAVLWVYNAIKVVIEDILAFLAFLFAWPDIVTTHRVMKNVFRQYASASVDAVRDFGTEAKDTFARIEASVENWAGIPPIDGTASGTSAANPPLPGQNSAPANLGVHHLQGNAANTIVPRPPDDGDESVLGVLVDTIQAEEKTIVGAFEAIKDDVVDQFATLTASQIIEKLVAILADAMLESVEHVLTAAIDVVVAAADSALGLLDEPVSIPVLSDLYRDLTGDDLSFLDVVCLVAAIPATLILKATTGSTPFPRGDAFTDGLVNATSFDDVRAQFMTALPQRSAVQPAHLRAMSATTDEDVLNQAKLKVFGLTAGIFALVGSIGLVIVGTIQKSYDYRGVPNPLPKGLATIAAVSNVAYVLPNIATLINSSSAKWYGDVNTAFTGISILKGAAYIPYAASQSDTVKYGFAGTETALNLVWNLPVAMNVADNHQNAGTTYKSLVPETIGNFAFNVGGMLELPIALAAPGPLKLAEIGTQSLLMLTYGSLMVVAGDIYESDPDQHH